MALQSMTGYGKNSASFQNKTIIVEIKSLNSKSLDLYAKTPILYRELELNLRQIIGDKLERGKIDFSISIENAGKTTATQINKELALAYYQDLLELNKTIQQPSSDFISIILKMPEILMTVNENISKEEVDFVIDLVEKTCNDLIDFRLREGKALFEEFSLRINTIKKLLEEVPKYESLRIETIRERMRKSLEEMEGSTIDSNRFEQELIYYIEKLDVSEEKMRLLTHLNFFMDTLKTESSGKKLGFITQEIGREINTLGSKSYHFELQKIVVEMKDNLEKIKEQVLNTL
jgi:uncharacterized protein (TIGR00255 family)